jgi:hypothetical protein
MWFERYAPKDAPAGSVLTWIDQEKRSIQFRRFAPLISTESVPVMPALIAPVFPELAGNFSSMSPRGFEARAVLHLRILKRAAVCDVKEKSRHDSSVTSSALC